MYTAVDNEWEWYIGQLFAHIIKKICKPEYISSVIELAPGYKLKIAYALKEINFTGDLYIIDEDKSVLDFVKKEYQKILPTVNIVCLHGDFKSILDSLPSQVDLFLGNHCLDDILLSNYIKRYKKERLMNTLTQDEITALWGEIDRNTEARDFIITDLVIDFLDLFNCVNIRHIILSQYKGNVFLSDLKIIDQLTRRAIKRVNALITRPKKNLDLSQCHPFRQDERYLGKDLLNNVQNENNWIVGEYIHGRNQA